MPKKDAVRRDPLEEIDLLDTMLRSLIELLDERGIIKESEWEQKVKQNVKG